MLSSTDEIDILLQYIVAALLEAMEAPAATPTPEEMVMEAWEDLVTG